MSRKQSVAVVWFKVTDLRTHDHEALHLAHESGLPVLHLFVVDPRWFKPTPLCGFPRTGSRRARFQLEALADLSGRLEAVGHGLCIRHGSTASVFQELCNDFHRPLVFAGHEVCAEEIRVQSAVEATLRSSGGQLHLSWAFELHHYDDLPRWLQQHGSNSYSGYKQVFHESCTPRRPLPRPDFRQTECVRWRRAEALPRSVAKLGLEDEPSPDARAEVHWRGGETAALAHVEDYLFSSDALALDYVGSTNTPREGNSCFAARAMSKLSPWLAHGNVSARLLYAEIKRYERSRHKSSSTYWLVHELYWRDFVRFQSFLVGSRIFKLGGIYNKHPQWKWIRDPGLLETWTEGRTGLPFVDAGCREIASTGYACHVARETVAWFLICDLGLDWRMGAEWFESVLVDYEPAANWFCWAFVCLPRATGGNGFREIGSPSQAPLTRLQTAEVVFLSAQHDPDGEYIKTWVPELRGLAPGLATREPWRATGEPRSSDPRRRGDPAATASGPDRVQMARRNLAQGGPSVCVWWDCVRGAAPATDVWPRGYPLPVLPPASFPDVEKVAEAARHKQAQKAKRVAALRKQLGRPAKTRQEGSWSTPSASPVDQAGGDLGDPRQPGRVILQRGPGDQPPRRSTKHTDMELEPSSSVLEVCGGGSADPPRACSGVKRRWGRNRRVSEDSGAIGA